MNSQIYRKNDGMRSQIRRKHIQQLFEKQRKAMIKRKKVNQNQESNQYSLNGLIIKKYLQGKNSMHLYENLSQISIYDGFTFLHKQNPYFQQEFLILILQNINLIDSAYTLGFFIIHLAIKKQENCNLLILFQKYNVCQTLYSKLKDFMDKKGGLKMVKLLLTCLKNCAFMNIPSLRNPQLLQKYIPLMIKQLLGQISMTVILANLSQVMPLDVKTIQIICNQAYSNQNMVKLATGSVIMNYVTLANQNDLLLSFSCVCQSLQHLINNSGNYSTTQGFYCFQKLGFLIQRFPNQQGELLMKMIKSTKLQQFLLLNLQFSPCKKKIQAFKVVQTIVDKLISQSQLLKQIKPQIYDYVVQGLQYSDPQTNIRSLKIIIKILHSGQNNFFYQFISKIIQLKYVLQNLCHHKNDYISANAEILINLLDQYFQKQIKMDYE